MLNRIKYLLSLLMPKKGDKETEEYDTGSPSRIIGKALILKAVNSVRIVETGILRVMQR